jgi:hypothetical protein
MTRCRCLANGFPCGLSVERASVTIIEGVSFGKADCVPCPFGSRSGPLLKAADRTFQHRLSLQLSVKEVFWQKLRVGALEIVDTHLRTPCLMDTQVRGGSSSFTDAGGLVEAWRVLDESAAAAAALPHLRSLSAISVASVRY